MDISNESTREAKQFAVKHGLSETAERELAELLERTWQDGCRAENFRLSINGLVDSEDRNRLRNSLQE